MRKSKAKQSLEFLASYQLGCIPQVQLPLLLCCARKYGNNNQDNQEFLLHKDFLPRDMFNLIMLDVIRRGEKLTNPSLNIAERHGVHIGTQISIARSSTQEMFTKEIIRITKRCTLKAGFEVSLTFMNSKAAQKFNMHTGQIGIMRNTNTLTFTQPDYADLLLPIVAHFIKHLHDGFSVFTNDNASLLEAIQDEIALNLKSIQFENSTVILNFNNTDSAKWVMERFFKQTSLGANYRNDCMAIALWYTDGGVLLRSALPLKQRLLIDQHLSNKGIIFNEPASSCDHANMSQKLYIVLNHDVRDFETIKQQMIQEIKESISGWFVTHKTTAENFLDNAVKPAYDLLELSNAVMNHSDTFRQARRKKSYESGFAFFQLLLPYVPPDEPLSGHHPLLWEKTRKKSVNDAYEQVIDKWYHHLVERPTFSDTTDNECDTRKMSIHRNA